MPSQTDFIFPEAIASVQRKSGTIEKPVPSLRQRIIELIFGLVWDGSNHEKGEFYLDSENAGKQVSVYKYASKANVIKETEESLRRLGTDYIDLLQIHWPDSTTPIAETMEALGLLIQQGKIRAAGVSNYSVAQVMEARKHWIFRATK